MLLDDWETAAAPFAEDAEIPESFGLLPPGAEAGAFVRARFMNHLNVSQSNMDSVELTAIEVDGNTVTFSDHSFWSRCVPISESGCIRESKGRLAVIEDGEIVYWDFGSVDFTFLEPTSGGNYLSPFAGPGGR